MRTAGPQYILPLNPKQNTVDGRALLGGLIFALLWNQLLTQVVAAYFHYQAALSGGFELTEGFLVYPPWQWMVWFFQQGMHSPEKSLHFKLAGVMVIGCFGMLAANGVVRWLSVKHNRDALANQGDLHGSAKFADYDEVLRTGCIEADRGVLLGCYPANDQFLTLTYRDDAHVIGIAPPGSGKTAGLAAPTLLCNPDHSMIVFDPKGELHDLTSGYRKAAGNAVFKFAPAELTGSRFNIFAELRIGTPYDVADAQQIAHIYCHLPKEVHNDPHWDDIAENLVVGVILHVAYKNRNEGTVITGRAIGAAFADVENSVDFVRTLEEMIAYEHDPDGRYHWEYNGAPVLNHPVVRQAAVDQLNRTSVIITHEEDGTETVSRQPGNEFNACLSNASKRFAIYRDPLIIRSTSGSDFRINDLVNGDKPATLYIAVALGDIDRLLPLLRAMITLIFYRLTNVQRIAKPNKWPLIWMLDEFTQLQKLEVIAKMAAFGRGFGMRVVMLTQSLKQVLDTYGTYQSIIDSAGALVASTPTDGDTAEHLSGLTGNMTVLHQTASFSGDATAPAQKTITTHRQAAQRPLMTPDEIRRMPRPTKDRNNRVTAPGDVLIFIGGFRPIYATQLLYFQNEILRQRASLAPLSEWDKIERKPRAAVVA